MHVLYPVLVCLPVSHNVRREFTSRSHQQTAGTQHRLKFVPNKQKGVGKRLTLYHRLVSDKHPVRLDAAHTITPTLALVSDSAISASGLTSSTLYGRSLSRLGLY